MHRFLIRIMFMFYKMDHTYIFSQEEALAKQAPSSYPEAEMILNSITPFLQLYQLYIDWDEAEKE